MASGAVLIALLASTVLAKVLSQSGTAMVSYNHGDLRSEFAYLYDYGFHAMRHGRFPLWCPYWYSGSPFYTESQIGLLYPPNWLFLFLPLALAVDLIMLLHVVLLGVGMFLWLRSRGLRFLSSLVGGILLMFCGPFFMHIFGGHVNNVSAMSWVPYFLIAADRIVEREYSRGILAGSAVLALQVLASQPQYTYYTLVTVALYVLVDLAARKAKATIKVAACVVAVGIIGSAITAVQLIPVSMQAFESTRSAAGLSFRFASEFSFPPENILTAIAPNVFGNSVSVPYWGRLELWEASLFIGVSGLVLALYGAAETTGRARWSPIVMIVVLGILGAGCHTPIYRVMYHYFPGFSRFRGTTKFMFDAFVFVALLAAQGLDSLITGFQGSRRWPIGLGIAAVICALAGIVVGDTSGNSNCISVWMAGIQSTGESLLNPAMLRNSQYIIAASGMASISLYVAAATLAANALLLKLRAKSVWPAYVMAAIAIAEVSLFAVGNLPTFPTSSLVNQPVNTFLHANLGDGRILLTGNPDMSIPLKASNIWGYDSFHLNRYAEFVAYANGTDPDDSVARNALHWTRLQHLDALLGILRWKYLVAMDENGARIVPVSTLFPPGAYHMLPRLCLMDRYITAPGRNSQFELMSNGHIDLQQTAIVESLPAPLPLPGKGPAGFVRIVQESDDSMVIEGDLVRPAILVIADTYAKGWQAESLSGSSQRSYDLKPVDYTLRGIAMQAGHQRLRVAFVPLGLRLGEVVSACGIAGYLIGLGLYLRLAAVRKIRSR